MKPILLLSLSVATLALAACSFDPDPDADLFTCASDADCGDGFVCATPFSNDQARPLAPRCVTAGSCVETERHCNAVDDDCDGSVDEEDESAVDLAAARTAGPFLTAGANCLDPALHGLCAEGTVSCLAGAVVCTSLGASAEGGDPVDPVGGKCDGFDNDCSGEVDEDIDLESEDHCGGCGNDFAAGDAPTAHYCLRTAAGAELTRCVNRTCVESPLACGNGQDDDADGLADCEDPDCGGKTCGSGSGFLCNAEAGECQCGAPVETDCGDGQDNDCNGRVDCRDDGCRGRGCNGADPTVNCGTSGCVLRESICDDALDDDADGLADCADLDCQRRACGAGQNCGLVAGAPACVPVEAVCGDAADDDGDGLTDCDDDDCLGQACAAAVDRNCGADGAGARGCVARESACGNGADDDRDGVTDCADADCEAAACGAGCLCQGGLSLETDCGDLQNGTAVDNDGDGQGNCADLGDCLGTSCGTGCACIEAGGVGVPLENDCGDGADNDSDGAADCLDPDCALQDCQLAGGPACICEDCPAGICPVGEVQCEDGVDNDADALRDCEDPGCAGRQCLNLAGCVCSGGAPTEAAAACSDGTDNDLDALFDCADADCAAASCGSGCVCEGAARTEAPAACSDSLDNDGDGAFDCGDSDCDGDPCGGGCTCGGGLRTESAGACADGGDNDGDGLTDCADGDCDGDACGLGCLCAGNTRTEAAGSCGDGTDNDLDALADCADPDCAGQDCGSGVAPSEPTDCSCSGGVGHELDCGNLADDDADGLTDCLDPDCAGVAPCPLVGSITPMEGPFESCAAGAPLQPVTITGRNFSVDATGTFTGLVDGVFLGGTACLNVIVRDLGGGDTAIDCETPAAPAAIVDVEVRNTGGFSGTLSGAYTFTTPQNTFDLCRAITTTLVANAGGATPDVEVEITKFGQTEAGPSAAITGQVGYGPAGSNPGCSLGWSWIGGSADPAVEPQSYDLYRVSFVAPPAAGTYGFVMRFSLDGVSWRYCDVDNVTPGTQAGVFTVN